MKIMINTYGQDKLIDSSFLDEQRPGGGGKGTRVPPPISVAVLSFPSHILIFLLYLPENHWPSVHCPSLKLDPVDGEVLWALKLLSSSLTSTPLS